MKKIKLKDEYPWYNNEYIEISDEIFEVFLEFSRIEHRQLEKIRYHKAFYSLDVLNGIEINILTNRISMEEKIEQEQIRVELFRIIQNLTPKQSARILKHYYEDMSINSIAKSENVDESSVRESIKRGLLNIRNEIDKINLI